MQSFIVEMWARLFGALRWISVFEPLRQLFPTLKNFGAVDVWVLANLLLSAGAAVLSPHVQSTGVGAFVAGYALLRTFEIVVYQINVLLFDEYRAQKSGKTYKVRGRLRLLIHIIQNYFEIVAWFAAIYILQPTAFCIKLPYLAGTTFGGIYSSFIVMSTFGEASIAPKNVWGATVLLYQSVLGLFMTLLSLARVISFLRTPDTTEEGER